MSIVYLTGRAGALKESAIARARASLAAYDAPLIFLVPDQYTLQSELDILTGFDSPGSFNLQVLSPARLCARVFAQAGYPKEARVDEQGRVVLMQLCALGLRDALVWYAGAPDQPGFAQRAVRQIDRFKQAGLKPNDITRMAEETTEDARRKKLADIALLYVKYAESLEGRFMDGEDELTRAVARMDDAPFLRNSRVIVYGFDTVTPSLARLIVALDRYANAVTVALALDDARDARDRDIFESAIRSLSRLDRLVKARGIIATREYVAKPNAPGRSARAHLARELYAIPSYPFDGDVMDVQAATLSNIAEEAAFAAALVRRLVRTKRWRYRDIMIACPVLDAHYEQALRRAFRLYDVPLFLASGRPADRHPLAQALLGALRLVTRGYALEDMRAYLRTGYAGLDDDEIDRLINYAEENGISGKKWRAPFARGDEELCRALEPLRERAVAPLAKLGRALKDAKDTREMLMRVCMFLEEIDAPGTLDRTRRQLEEMGLFESAAEGAQVWNRIVAALDQLAELLPEHGIRAGDIDQLLRRALAATVVKSLPQSSDAVEGGDIGHMTRRAVKALILMGMSAEQPPDGDALLDARETQALSEQADAYLGATREELGCARKALIKALLALPSEYLAITRPINDLKGDAVEAGQLMNEIERILPKLKERGGVLGDAGIARMLVEAKDAAVVRLAKLAREDDPLAAEVRQALAELPETAEALARVDRAAAMRVESEPIAPELARDVYGALTAVSASRLELFNQCPFRHFVRYALRPEPFEPMSFTPIDKGVFYHTALDRFVRENRADFAGMSPEACEARMDAVTQSLIERLTGDKAQDSALVAAQVRQLGKIARYSARTLVSHLHDSLFQPVETERDIELVVPVDENRYLAGRIDRVDAWTDGAQKYVRVIDYKTGGRTLSLSDIYYGVQMQLLVYLATAVKAQDALPAGAFYFGVDEPIIETDARDAETVERARMREMRMDGLVLKDERVLSAMAAHPDEIMHVRMGKDGAYSQSGKVVTQDEFDAMIRHTCRLARDEARAIAQGDTNIAPVRTNDRFACDYCDCGVACQFDERVPGGVARELKRLDADEALARMTAATQD